MWFVIRLILFPVKLALKVLAPLALLLVAGLVGYLFFWLPDVSILAEERPESSAFMKLTRDRYQSQGLNRRISHSWVELDKISPALVEAVLIAEDDRFYLHRGFDFTELMNAAEANLKSDRPVRGGSTITQQLAKNLYLSPEKSYTRKLNEALLTWKLEHSLTKDRILEMYLNVAEWGDGIFGVEEAAKHHFNTTAAKLNESQAVTLAAMLPSPHEPRDRPGQRREAREKVILSRLKNSPPGYRGTRRILLVEKQKNNGVETGGSTVETYRRLGDLAKKQKDQWWENLFGDRPFEWEEPVKAPPPKRPTQPAVLPREELPRENRIVESAPSRSEPPQTGSTQMAPLSAPAPPMAEVAGNRAKVLERVERIEATTQARPPSTEPPAAAPPPGERRKSSLLQEKLAHLEKVLSPRD